MTQWLLNLSELCPATETRLTVVDRFSTKLMTLRQVAALMQMRLSTVESYARRGLLPSVTVSRHRRFIRSEVERALAALAEGH